jgi:EpsI family protein
LPSSPGAGGFRPDAFWIGTALAAVVLIAIWKPVYGALISAGPAGAPQIAPVSGANGWLDTGRKVVPWQPHFVGPAAERSQGFQKGDLRVGLYLAYYVGQEQGAELIGSQNQLVSPRSSRWRKVASGEEEIRLAGSPLRVWTADIVGPGDVRLRAWQWYWINGRLTSNDYAAKAYTVLDRLLGRGDHAAVVVVYAPMRDVRDVRDAAATDALSAFVAEMGPGIEQRLDEVRGR